METSFTAHPLNNFETEEPRGGKWRGRCELCRRTTPLGLSGGAGIKVCLDCHLTAPSLASERPADVATCETKDSADTARFARHWHHLNAHGPDDSYPDGCEWCARGEFRPRDPDDQYVSLS